MKPCLATLLVLTLIVSLCTCAASRLGGSTFDHDPVLLGDPGQEIGEETTDETTPQPRDLPYTPTTTAASGGDLEQETWNGEPPEATPADLVIDAHGEVSQEPWPMLTEEESAGGYIRLHNYVRIDYVNVYTQETYGAYYIVPEFTLESEAAQTCNREIREVCDPIVEEAVAYAATSPDVNVEIDYRTGRGYGAVSLCVCITSISDQYLVYTLDTQTGELLENHQIAALAGVPEEEYWELLRAALQAAQAKYSDEYRDDFYYDRLEKTCAEENLEEATLFLGSGGELMAVGKVYSIAGAEYYWRVFPVEVG